MDFFVNRLFLFPNPLLLLLLSFTSLFHLFFLSIIIYHGLPPVAEFSMRNPRPRPCSTVSMEMTSTPSSSRLTPPECSQVRKTQFIVTQYISIQYNTAQYNTSSSRLTPPRCSQIRQTYFIVTAYNTIQYYNLDYSAVLGN